MRPFSIRAKLTLWYLLVTFAGALLFGITSYGVLHYALLEEKKTHLNGREVRLMRLLDENRAQHVTASLEEQLTNYALVTHEGNLFQLRQLDGSLLFPADTSPSTLSTSWASSGSSNCSQRSYYPVRLDSSQALVLCHAIVLNGKEVRLYLGGMLDEEMDILRIYRDALLFLLPGLLILSSFCGYFLSRRAMKPVDRM